MPSYVDVTPPPALIYEPLVSPSVPIPSIWQVRGGGVLVAGFSTAQPFTAAQYAAYRGVPLATAQALINAAVAAGYVAVV